MSPLSFLIVISLNPDFVDFFKEATSGFNDFSLLYFYSLFHRFRSDFIFFLLLALCLSLLFFP